MKMEMKDTIQLMESNDYKDRLKAECHQTKIRFENLRKTIIKADAGTIQPKNIGLLREQIKAMGEYLYILEVRAETENIEL
jgi:hypothetical protein